MTSKKIVWVALALGALVVIFYGIRDSQDDTAYAAEITEERETVGRYMRTSPESPFASARGEFRGLRYFPPDADYRIIARFDAVDEKKQRVLKTSDGLEQRYREYGYASFDIGGVQSRLLILEALEPGAGYGKLFLGFGDETTARETYGAGRYLDVKRTPGSATITLDFNKAYNPYCAYNDTYSCPLPPAENLLAVPIRAGEKSYH